MGSELLTLRDISKYYTSGQSVVMGLTRVNLAFRAGEFVAITGESGSGKSTLAKVMAGILPYESGEMLLSGRPTSHYDSADWERYRSHSISFISQNYDILPGCTVLRNTVSALRLTGMTADEAALRAEEILRQVELWDLRNRRAAKLSSGQKQRLSIARALAKPAPILIADEPTGNLDSENSAKIIELLSAAARDRLVLMVTHDFEEAQDFATRRITIQDGAVTSDIALRSPTETAAPIKQERKPLKGLSLYTALLQMTARPVWTTIMLTFFTLTAFAVFAFLGTFIVNLDDTSTRIYDHSAFRNGDMERIVVVHPDGETLTDSDLSTFLSVPHVESAERFGYVTDINYFYREGIDYFSHYSASGGGMLSDNTTIDTEVTLEGYSLFLSTVPATADGGEFLTAGRLPETAYEVVAGDESLLGQTVRVYVQDSKNWNRTAYVVFDAEVVGTTDMGPHLYFSDLLGRAMTGFLRYGGYLILPDHTNDLDGGFLCSKPLHQQMTFWLEETGSETIDFKCPAANYETLPLKLLGTHDVSTLLYSLAVSPDTFDLLVEADYGPQMSLTIEDYAYTDAVVDAVRALGYGALSPYQMGSNKQDPTLAAERMQTLKVCLMAFLMVVALQIVVLRAMFSMETEEFRILKNLGLRYRNAARSLFWQTLFFALSGEGLAVLVVFLCKTFSVERIVSILHYLPAPCILATWAVHLSTSLLTVLWITSALRRQVYPATGAAADLDMDEEVDA